MLILALDTTSEHGGVALYRDLESLANVHNTGSTGFSVTLFQMADQALAEGGAKLLGQPIPLREVELFAAANGPGSFTGIRTGLAAVQGWATALGRPVIGVSILAAMAQEAQFQTEWAASIMDARRNEFYLGLFRRESSADGDYLSQDGDGMVLNCDQIRNFLADQLSEGKAVTCINRDQDIAAQALRADLPGSASWQAVPAFLGGTIARMGLEAHGRGKLQSPAQLDALYIRRPDAEVNWRP
ncbi:MAG TPA: tRNA (adenosine(37)-N6)-threonylcarbamoyltransferase complex dimerization subunit type 1 TsaB [Terriglobia bacterium]|nr:tRNA (adenosine(37)-N6)-threonylcarbamoyltransferase complex dimerization subunit type 1 TsaB [Terriglobia bacterium]